MSNPATIQAATTDDVATSRVASLDFSKQFLPESFTPLYFTASYATLNYQQRLRYNQLQALYFNEQIIFFETTLGQNVLSSLANDPKLARLRDELQQFAVEEQRHTAMFRRLNQQAAPHLYRERDFYFVCVPRPWDTALNGATKRPRLFLVFIWLMLLQEERSLYYSREIIRQRDSLEPHFVAVHRAHIADEINHVRWDEELLDELWRHASPLRRHFNARLFQWMLAEFFSTPKRAQLRVIDELAREFPDLTERVAKMKRALLALSNDRAYHLSLYSREIVPTVFGRFDEWKEFRALSQVMAGYEPMPPRTGALEASR